MWWNYLYSKKFKQKFALQLEWEAIAPPSIKLANTVTKSKGNKKEEKSGEKAVKPEAAVLGSKKHGIRWKEGKARAKAENKPQGQWAREDIDYATKMANSLKPKESGYFKLPKGSKSIVYMPDGRVIQATLMWLRNNGTGTWHGYPMP